MPTSDDSVRIRRHAAVLTLEAEGVIYHLAPGLAIDTRREVAGERGSGGGLAPSLSRCQTFLLCKGEVGELARGRAGGGKQGDQDAGDWRELPGGKTSKFVQVSACAGNSAAVTESGEVWVWGPNGCGQLGRQPWGDEDVRHVPEKLAPLRGEKQRNKAPRQARIFCVCVCVCVRACVRACVCVCVCV